MSYRTNVNTPPDGAAITALLDAGLPVGPLAEPDRFYQASKSGKYHALTGCNRLMTWSIVSDVDLRTVKPDAFCKTCVDGPASKKHAAYLRHARQVTEARRKVATVRARLIADRLDITPETVQDSEELCALAWDLTRPLELAPVTWERVSQAEAAVRLLQEIRDDEHVHPDMLDHLAPLDAIARALHEQLRAAAHTSNSTGQLVRGCVLDLMATHTGSHPVEKLTPDGADGPVSTPDAYPAVCSTGADWGPRFSAQGFEGLVTAAWKVWRAEVRATDDLDAARAAVLVSTQIGSLEPKYHQQFAKDVPVESAPAGLTLWQWLVTEWRKAATAELVAITEEWAATFRSQMVAAQDQPAKVVALAGWTLDERTADNASTRVLAQLPVVFSAKHDSGLTIAPGVVATWLERYDVHGKYRAPEAYRPTGTVKVLGDALPSDGPEMLSTAFTLWREPTGDRSRYRPRNELDQIGTAVVAAQGIHAAA